MSFLKRIYKSFMGGPFYLVLFGLVFFGIGGESVQVIYSPENPEKAVIKGEGLIFRIIFMIVGGVVVTLGLVIFGTNVSNSYLEQGSSDP